MKIILGSASPRRKELLGKLGAPFEVITAGVDEDSITVPDPAQNVLARARLKAAALQSIVPENAIVITADTTVADGAEMLNKPANEQKAWSMLNQLRGRTHQVHTGVIIRKANGVEHEIINTTDVVMRPYTDQEITDYIATGDPVDKAGAYAIQHPAFRPVERIEGCYTGVMGFPLCDVAETLQALGAELAIDKNLSKKEAADFCLCSRCAKLFSLKS
ncbi:MAG: Maf family protein [Chloroflexota bacterium]